MTDINMPKYQMLKEYIIDKIKTRKLEPGEKIYSENELADRFGVSRHTVRQAIGDLVGEGWLYRIQGKGTYVDSRPDYSKTKGKTIGVITTYLNDYIFPSIIRGVDGVLSANGFSIMLGCTYNQHDKERICLEALKQQDIAGLIVESTKSALPNPNLDLYRDLHGRGIPILFIHGCYKNLDYSYIVEDDELAGYMATRHLFGLGHSKIGGIFKIDDIQGHYRFCGYQRAYSELNNDMSDNRIVWFDTWDMEQFLKGNLNKISSLFFKCTAIVCYNEQIAVKVVDAAREAEFNIPEDISLVTFDDSQLAVASGVKLTTIAHPKEDLGKKAGDIMLRMIKQESTEIFSIKMPPELIVRESTKAVKPDKLK